MPCARSPPVRCRRNPGARAADAAQMEQNKKTVAAFYDAVLNKKDFDEASTYLGPRYTQHNPDAPRTAPKVSRDSSLS